MAEGNINIGMAIRDELKKQERSVAWFARQLGTNRMACYRIFESYSIDTYMLLKISRVLDYDFFSLYSDNLRNDANV
ncbi:MAG: XRE family transcriptional regulator [Bacteroidales bacterium]|nr:XRE family transcriptional regulator [Bacteroidales bacterium]